MAGVLRAMRVAGRDEVRGRVLVAEAFLSARGHATLRGQAVVSLGTPAVALPREVRSATSVGTGRTGTQAFPLAPLGSPRAVSKPMSGAFSFFPWNL